MGVQFRLVSDFAKRKLQRVTQIKDVFLGVDSDDNEIYDRQEIIKYTGHGLVFDIGFEVDANSWGSNHPKILNLIKSLGLSDGEDYHWV